MLNLKQTSGAQPGETRSCGVPQNPFSELTAPRAGSRISSVLHGLCLIGAFFVAGNRIHGQQAEKPKAGPLETEGAKAQMAELKKIIGPLLSGENYEGLSENQKLQKQAAALRAALDALPKTAEYEWLRSVCEKRLDDTKMKLAEKSPQDKVRPVAPPLAGPAKIPMFEWTPGNLFDGKGQYRRMVYAKKGPYNLSPGDALQGLIIAVEVLKSEHKGSIPPGYEVQVGKEINGIVDRNKAIVPMAHLPRSVTPQSLEMFKRSPGHAALGIISSSALPVVFSSRGGQGLHFAILQNPRQGDVGNHWFVELVPTGKMSR